MRTKRRIFYGYIIVIASFFILALIWGTMYSFGIFFKPVLTEFGWLRAETSGAFSLCLVLNGLAGIFSGRLTDKFGPRVVISVCGLLLGLGYLLMSLINALWQFYLIYGVIIGIGISCGWAPAVATIARWFAKYRGLMTGLAVSGIGFGMVVMSPVASWLIANYGWRKCYIIVGLAILVLLIGAAQFLRRDPRQMGLVPYGEDQPNASLFPQAKDISFEIAVRTREFWMIGAMLACFGFVLGVVMVHLVAHVTDLGISAHSAAGILSAVGGSSMAGRIWGGLVSGRLGNRKTVLIGFILVFLSALWLLFAGETWMFYLFGLVLGFAYGSLATLGPLLQAECFGLAALGVIAGAVNCAATMGEALGPVVAGKIFDSTGSYMPAFALCLAISCIGLVLAALLYRKLRY